MRKIYLSFILCFNLYSQTNEVNFDEISVTANEQIKDKKVGERKIDAETINKQQVTDSRDLVRYETGVSVVEAGRMGSSGYAIRGVDENRVGITIDGLRQAETLSSQGFKELFEGYGNFNNTRNGIEMENVKMATITKGADSIKSGSGALGGSVMFETKDAKDFLIDKNYHFSFKNGFQSVDDQKFRSITAAAKFKWFDVLIVNTQRNGHEHKNYFYDIYKSSEEDKAAVGKTREKADPYEINRKSTLIKIGFEPFENQRFSVAIDDSKLSSKGEDLSYLLRPSEYVPAEIAGERKNSDSSTRKNIQYAFESFTQTPFWDSVKISYSNQKIKNKARTDDYCSGDKCKNVLNPKGLKLDSSSGSNKVVGTDGAELKVEAKTSRWSTTPVYKIDGKILENNKDYKEWKADSTFINCEKIDCTKKYTTLIKTGYGRDQKYDFKDLNIITKEHNGLKYGQIDTSSMASNEQALIIIPGTSGFETNYVNDRDLNTDTNQFNIDFDKEFELLGTEHFIKYGAMHSKTKKSMVNQDGQEGGNVQWWQEYFYGYDQYIDANYNFVKVPNPGKWAHGADSLRNIMGRRDSYLIPVETKESAVYFGDYIKTFEWLGLDLNYRYDKVVHNPSYDENVPVPKGLIAGIFIPLPDNPYGAGAPCGYHTPCMAKNLKQNLDILLRKADFKSDSYSFGVDLDPLSWLRVQLKYSKGFRAPTSDEMYMTFKHPSFSIAPNTNLKAEIAKTKELAVTFHNNNSFATFNVFKTDYTNFIDLAYLEYRQTVESTIAYPFYQNINRDKAQVKGFEINSRIELGDISDKLQGFRFGYKLTHQKGRMNGNIPMNALQPTTSVYNIGYSTPDDKYGIDLFLTDVSAKKAEDTYNMYWKQQGADPNRLVQGKRVTDSKMAWRSGAYKVFDMIAYAKPTKNFSFGFGVYNITDEKYMTWDKARSIRAFGAANLIDQNTGAGIGRFYAPRRNFRFSWEITF
ncbi:TonB-dependent hemoglobin/transferrin/lactoferrin family receptor [Campylobacter mucosalis]|uniref:TonB-dependent hemoglobin/transferrin/lactoferrin family receptor n=1 Tax=Campylobacter mucosalis TaxID=202 RepID=UPI0014703BDC|nr:TonB-dependent hemoglobin/transferrin/lactoferrin family receptor [Campylobacter mucosalis]